MRDQHMSLDWDERHRIAGLAEDEPSGFLLQALPLLSRGKVLDCAMGRGRNSLFMAAQGFEVLGLDTSPEAVRITLERASAMNVTVQAEVADLEYMELPAGSFDVVMVFNYLQRSLFDGIRNALKPGGALVYETYTCEQLRYRELDRRYLLEPNELLRAFSDFHIVLYRELDRPADRKATASLLAFRR